MRLYRTTHSSHEIVKPPHDVTTTRIIGKPSSLLCWLNIGCAEQHRILTCLCILGCGFLDRVTSRLGSASSLLFLRNSLPLCFFRCFAFCLFPLDTLTCRRFGRGALRGLSLGPFGGFPLGRLTSIIDSTEVNTKSAGQRIRQLLCGVVGSRRGSDCPWSSTRNSSQLGWEFSREGHASSAY